MRAGGDGLDNVHCLSFQGASLDVCRWQSVFHVVLAQTSLTREDVAVVCVLVLLLGLGRSGFAELRPLFRVSAYTLDAYVDVRDVQRFVVETTQVERSWVNWDLVAAGVATACEAMEKLNGRMTRFHVHVDAEKGESSQCKCRAAFDDGSSAFKCPCR